MSKIASKEGGTVRLRSPCLYICTIYSLTSNTYKPNINLNIANEEQDVNVI